MRVLAGDIGGTKTAMAIAEIGERHLSILRFERYLSADFGSLEEILDDFLASERRRPSVAGFGVAGPGRSGRAKITKLPWVIEEERVARATGIARGRVWNDFVAAALGISYLPPPPLVTLAPGRGEPGGP